MRTRNKDGPGRRFTFEGWSADLLSTPPLFQAEFIRRSLRSKRMLPVFGRYFFPHVIQGEYETPECHVDLVAALSSPESSGIVFPRGFAKTTWERVDTLHDVVYALEPVIVFYGASDFDVEQHFEAVKRELETNDALRAVYGNLVPDVGKPGTKWNTKRIRTTNGVNVVGRGAGKGRGVNIGGRRPTKVVVDDGETDELVRSARRREKYWRWITEVIEPSLDKERGRLKVIGTVIHPKCAVKRFYDERGGIFRKAIEGGKSIWPEYWSLEALYRKRDGFLKPDGTRVLGIGSRAFSQEYLNESLGDGLTMFRLEWLDSNTYESLPPREFMDVYMAVDPAAGESSLADDYGACVIGRDRRDGKRYVLHSSRYQGGVGTAVRAADGSWAFTGAQAWFDSIYRAWDPIMAGIEASQTVQAFWQIIRDSGRYRVTKLRPSMGIGGKEAKKEERAKLVEPHVEGGMVKFSPKQHDLYDQMTAFPSQDVKDDVFDAFMHCMAMLDGGGGGTSDVSTATTETGTSRIRSRNF